MKRVLLTGANGFIGKNIIEALGEKYTIIRVSRSSEYDIGDLDSLMGIDGIDLVIHGAAKTFVPDSFDNPYDFYRFNINSALNIAEFCRVKRVKQLIYLNSYTYGSPEYLPIDECHRVSFHSPYNKSKYIAEELLFQYLEGHTKVVSLRLFNLYGKGQSESFLIPTILKQMLESKRVCVKDLDPKRDFLYIKDLMSLIEQIAERNDREGVYNVGSGKSHSVEEIIAAVKRVLNREVEVRSEKIRRENEVMDCYADIGKVTAAFGWNPGYDLISGIRDYIKEVENV